MEKHGKAATRAKNKYRDKSYDRIEIIFPKGRKDEIKASADKAGQSLNGFIAQAVDERIERMGGRSDEKVKNLP